MMVQLAHLVMVHATLPPTIPGGIHLTAMLVTVTHKWYIFEPPCIKFRTSSDVCAVTIAIEISKEIGNLGIFGVGPFFLLKCFLWVHRFFQIVRWFLLLICLLVHYFVIVFFCFIYTIVSLSHFTFI